MGLPTIINTLEKLEKMHRSLFDLALKKTDYIKSNDLEALDALIKTEQAHVAAIETLEQQRQEQVELYLDEKEYSYTDVPTVANVIDASQGEQGLQQVILLRERLVEVVEKLKSQNDLNQKLVFQSLQFINVSLNMLRPQTTTEQMNYSDSEIRGENKVGKKSYFNSQA